MRLEQSHLEAMRGYLGDQIGSSKIRNLEDPFLSHNGSSYRVQCKDDNICINMIA
jgi:hypothetical protein